MYIVILFERGCVEEIDLYEEKKLAECRFIEILKKLSPSKRVNEIKEILSRKIYMDKIEEKYLHLIYRGIEGEVD